MVDVAPLYQLVEHPWVSAPTAAAGGPTRASVVASYSGGPATTPAVKRDAALACATTKAYLFGGQDLAGLTLACAPRPSAEAYDFDFTTRVWSALPPLPTPITQAKAAASGDDFVFVFGGWLGDAYSDALWLLAPREHPSLQPSAEEQVAPAQGGAATAATSSKGAAALPADNSAKADKKSRGKDATESSLLCWRLLRTPVDVHGCARAGPCARVGHSLVKATLPPLDGATDANSSTGSLDNTVLYLFGGFDGHEWLNDVWRLRVGQSLRQRKAIWECVTTSGWGAMSSPSARSDAAVAFDGVLQRLYVCFGRTSSALLNDVWELDLTTQAWRALTTAGAIAPRCGAVAVVPDGVHLYVLAGEGDAQRCIPQLLRLSLLDYKWQLLAPVAALRLLSGRHGFVAVGGNPGERGCLLLGGAGSSSSLIELVLDPTHIVDAPAKRK